MEDLFYLLEQSDYSEQIEGDRGNFKLDKHIEKNLLNPISRSDSREDFNSGDNSKYHTKELESSDLNVQDKQKIDFDPLQPSTPSEEVCYLGFNPEKVLFFQHQTLVDETKGFTSWMFIDLIRNRFLPLLDWYRFLRCIAETVKKHIGAFISHLLIGERKEVAAGHSG